MQVLDYIRVVLVEPTHPGNIGAVARAMANMGATRLTLVAPAEFPSPAATARAAGADHILDAAEVVADIDQAVAECALIIGLSARLRSIQWPCLTPAAAMKKAVETARQAPAAHAALVFGREDRGLTNLELERCHYLTRIPAAAAFPSLNLAAAALVMLYELRHAAGADAPESMAAQAAQAGFGLGVGVGKSNALPPQVADPPAVASELRAFYHHLERVLALLEFSHRRNADKLHRKLTRLFNRARPYAQEIRMLRGILSAIEEKLAAKPPP